MNILKKRLLYEYIIDASSKMNLKNVKRVSMNLNDEERKEINEMIIKGVEKQSRALADELRDKMQELEDHYKKNNET